MRSGFFKYGKLLRICDNSPTFLQAKGTNIPFVSSTIVFTTNVEPTDWWPRMTAAAKAPFFRRLYDYANIYDFHPRITGTSPCIVTRRELPEEWKGPRHQSMEDLMQETSQTHQLNQQEEEFLRMNIPPLSEEEDELGTFNFS